ncbi:MULTISPECIES: tRNA (adenosine(37)-N6)-threonylcarbamoyltransferase complex dimerization subunit type 1 TsaB [unclassified Tatumella]|uniref:tRNA (adenosine(37)-N6)-threonylcarbamoyltransferase complex dimerization subunit type 1 TsaB n=1 Tax=unclassified Tatumella TaxID=2649542 RepID=UPI001BB0C932|nr:MULTISPECIES: tRNA (adenosine(37)-N6)-threonylcarbamoyltransferase complex dimerization subunit type 1 TsaB [unclassified Tatumella]MBS0855370.1 tRNA (adenosine(37)-N6)-threonylcarbamoyltransferase complex dimerization subunit type 1 TsaB [Tatumella sp. JGM16]MBS0894081.1 tRNA (adenosine(37)-N6)-threonylcarbamoyltransferase complex dimerization subunit type 1 TsaB [Tatumella sp. JGM130]MBS0911604.1 tRNA (adenosine(37)-N6)-threonylcarbamoyltransferase complex dimerization subunit type 1 TsaB [
MQDISKLKLLALDTATEACSAAIFNQQQQDARFEIAPRDHTRRILPLVSELLEGQQLTLTDLDALVFCRGPGSFTGVRIGIGIAQGLALGADLPMIGVSTLATLAEGAWRGQQASRVLTAIDARMGEVYWAEYQRDAQGEWQGSETEQVLSPQQAQQRMQQLSGAWVTAGTGWQTYPQLQQEHCLQLTASDAELPCAADMLPLAINQWRKGALSDVAAIEPVYLRNEVTWKKLPGR